MDGRRFQTLRRPTRYQINDGGAYNIKSVPNLMWLLDARYGIAKSGSNVTSWTDNVASKVLSAVGTPTYSASDSHFNGRPSVTFGSGNAVQAASVDSFYIPAYNATAGGCTWLADVWIPSGAAAAPGAIIDTTNFSTSGTGILFYWQNTGSTAQMVANVVNSSGAVVNVDCTAGAGTAPTNARYRVSMRFGTTRPSGAPLSQLRQNGTQVATDTSLSGSWPTGNPGFAIAVSKRANAGTFYWPGAITQVALFSRYLTDAEITAWENAP